MDNQPISGFWTCTACGHQVTSQNPFCTNCGTPDQTQQSFSGLQPSAQYQPAPSPQATQRTEMEVPSSESTSLKAKKEQGRNNIYHKVSTLVAVGMFLMFMGVALMIISIPTEPAPDEPIQPSRPKEPEETYLIQLADEPVRSDYNLYPEPQTSDHLTSAILNAEPDPTDYDYDEDFYTIDYRRWDSDLENYTYGDTINNRDDSNYSVRTFSDSEVIPLANERTSLYRIPEDEDVVHVYFELYSFLTDYESWKNTKYDPAMNNYETAQSAWDSRYDNYQTAHDLWQNTYTDAYNSWFAQYKSWEEHEYRYWNDIEYPKWQQDHQEWQREYDEWREEHNNDEKKTAQNYKNGMLIHNTGAIIASTVLMVAGFSLTGENLLLRRTMIVSGTVILVVMFAIPLGFSLLLGL